jgi:phosphoribosylformylglycinamidine synthase subunit PurS
MDHVTRGPIGPRGILMDRSNAMKARVTVTLKNGVLDPQGKAIEGALKSLGVAGVASVRQGKVFDIELEAGDATKAEATLKEAAEKLLANTVIENFRVEVTAVATQAEPTSS